MEGFITALLCALLVIGYVFITKYRELRWKNELSEYVSWVVSDKRRDMSLWRYVSNAQNHCKLAEQYRISTDEEWQYVREILEEFKKDLSSNYFDGALRAVIKSKYVITEELYFMFALCDFLTRHQCDYDFIGHNMHDKILDHKSYGNLTFSATYLVSDFAMVFNKLLYVAYVSCKNHKGIGEYYDNEGYIEEILKTKELGVNNF